MTINGLCDTVNTLIIYKSASITNSVRITTKQTLLYWNPKVQRG